MHSIIFSCRADGALATRLRGQPRPRQGASTLLAAAAAPTRLTLSLPGDEGTSRRLAMQTNER